MPAVLALSKKTSATWHRTVHTDMTSESVRRKKTQNKRRAPVRERNATEVRQTSLPLSLSLTFFTSFSCSLCLTLFIFSFPTLFHFLSLSLQSTTRVARGHNAHSTQQLKVWDTQHVEKQTYTKYPRTTTCVSSSTPCTQRVPPHQVDSDHKVSACTMRHQHCSHIGSESLVGLSMVSRFA